MRHGLMIAGLSAWILWAHNFPTPTWMALAATETQAGCEGHLTRLKEPPQVSVAWTIRCLPAGLEPDRVHGLYDLNLARMPPEEGE